MTFWRKRKGATTASSPWDAAIAQAEKLIDQGNAFEDQGEFAAALSLYEDAIAKAPCYDRPYLNAGNALASLDRTAEAEAAYRKAIELAPERPGARSNLARLKLMAGDLDAAEALARDELQLKPGLAETQTTLALVLEERGFFEDAERILRDALAVQPDLPGVSYNLGMMLLRQDRFDESLPRLSQARKVARDSLSAMLFRLGNRFDLGPEELFRRHLLVGKEIQESTMRTFADWQNMPDPDRRVRVGYVSADFCFHPIGMFMHPVLAHSNHDRFDVYCYSSTPRPDAATDHLRAMPVVWRDIASKSDDELADMVRQDQIDLLIDLSGHTTANRLAMFAQHPAPVQATWMGYLNTTGLPAMDYRICDRQTDPEECSARLSTERLVYLAHSQWCYTPWWAPADPVPVERSGGRVRFGSVNKYSKISDPCVETWAQILVRVPDSELSLLGVPDDSRSSVIERFARHGIDPSRISIAGRVALRDYYLAIAGLDIALDSRPYSGGTTTLDTLWMGTPVVATAGNRPTARSAYSILHSAGMQELIAENPDDLIALNAKLACDAQWRRRLHATLRLRLARSPLMDVPAFMKDLEACYRRMWTTWCDGR